MEDNSTEQLETKTISKMVTESMPASILVVDDEVLVRDFLLEALEEKGYAVTLATCCDEALDKLEQDPFDLVLSDINMPGMSGNDLLELCKETYQSTEVILITGDPNLEGAVNSVKQGAFDYLSKPISPEKLYERVDSALKHVTKTSGLVNHSNPTAKNGYSVVRTLGAGNMGIVLLVQKDSKYYAMKILRCGDNDENHKIRVQRFIREAEILSKIKHPNVIRIFEYGVSEEEEIPYIIMEFVAGEPLNRYMESHKLTHDDSIKIITQLAEALAMVHQFGILHRDIKPGNILLTENLDVKLTDFGIAKIENSDLTMTREVLGSPAYMSPESFDSSIVKDCRSDIFSLGVIAYELLTGIKPFYGETIGELMNAIQYELPIEPLKINDSFPPYMQDILAKMLAKDPDERFSSPEGLLKALHLDSNAVPVKEGITRKLLRSLFLKRATWA